MKNQPKTAVALLLIALWASLSGCSTPKQSKFDPTTVEQIKAGMAKSEVARILGEPRSRLTDNEGNQVWEFRKNAQEGKGMRTYSNVATLGLNTLVEAEFQDILTVVFKADLVVKATYQENVQRRNSGLGR